MRIYQKFNKKIDRRSPRNEKDYDSPYMRENLLTRDGKLQKVKGTKTFCTTLTAKPTWMGRYYTVETGQISPKTFCYTVDGKLWHISETGVATELLTTLNTNAYPKHYIFKTQTQSKMYLVEGKDLYKYDGNNDNKWEKVVIEDTDGHLIYPIDLIEHKDRLILISETFIYVSKNLFPDIFDDATDSIQFIVGSSKGKNKALGKIKGNDTLYIATTEGIYRVYGDVISAVASTWGIEWVDSLKIIAGRSWVNVENALMGLADDLNVWAFNGSSSEKKTHSEKLEDFVNPVLHLLDKAVAVYEDNYYKLSFVEMAFVDNNLELWYDALSENICEFVRGRGVGCYLEIDATREERYYQFGLTHTNYLMWANTEWDFNGVAIRVRLWTKDITYKKGQNVRFKGFYPEIISIGDTHTIFAYNLDSRLDGLSASARWTQSLKGETRPFGVISLVRGDYRTYVVKPKVRHAKGQSVSFYVDDSTLGSDWKMLGIGIEFTPKEMKKNELVGV